MGEDFFSDLLPWPQTPRLKSGFKPKLISALVKNLI